MNTGIQDAYNLAWKLALVVRNRANESLLESYEMERRPVGKEVVASTTRASANLGDETAAPDRLEGTQLLVSYRGTDWVENATFSASSIGPVAGDRVPDCHNLNRAGVGFPLRLFDVLRGTDHVLLAYCPDLASLQLLAKFMLRLRELGIFDIVRAAAIAPAEQLWEAPPQLPVYIDSVGSFSKMFGKEALALLVRPDGYLAWRGQDLGDAGLAHHLTRVFVSSNK